MPRHRGEAGGVNAKGNNHPAQYPAELAEWIVRLLCPEFGVVLDPFMGAGSTAEGVLRAVAKENTLASTLMPSIAAKPKPGSRHFWRDNPRFHSCDGQVMTSFGTEERR